MSKIIKQKERDIILQSLKSGVVPKIGLQHIQVGRNMELASFIKDIDNVADGGASFRLVIGEYGSGKTFFLSLVRSIALEKGLVTMNADLSPTKRLHGTNGQSRMLLSEFVNNISTRTKQDGNALPNIIEKFISSAKEEACNKNVDTEFVIKEKLSELNEYTNGYCFQNVIIKYFVACENGDNMLKDCALRWLKAEYTSKTDSYKELGIREFLDDSSLFNTLKLYSVFIRKAGYKGLLVCMDEMVNLYKITNSVSRKSNYEEILSILNNTLQGSIRGLGFIMSGTPEFLTDRNRGLYGYEALKSRLAENSFSQKTGLIDYNSTVLRLSNLTKEELYMLLVNLRNVFACGNVEKYLVPDEALLAYLNYCNNKIGESYFRTPRNTIKGFVDLLSILEQYNDKKWSEVIDEIDVKEDVENTNLSVSLNSDSLFVDKNEIDEFASFKL